MIRKVLLSLMLTLVTISSQSQSLTINEAVGWFESGYLTWQPNADAESYNVYYSGEGIDDQKIDDQLIRKYENHFRADILGLKAGNYTFKVAPVTSGLESEATTSPEVTVEAHDRSGFAFSNNRMPGAYKADGTLKSDVVVLYITENTKDLISMEVTGANENPFVGLLTILEGFKKGNDNRPLAIRLIGHITDPAYLNKGDIVIENKNNDNSHITIEGVGIDAVADGWGIRLKNASNIEVRNIGLMNCDSDEGDNLGLQQDNDHVWVHHCDFFYGNAGGDSDQTKGDGALDCKRSTYVTFSYNHFWDTGKTNLLGLSEDASDPLFITYHHNWYDHSDSRHPRVRYFSAHVYNNYYDGISKYGVGSTEGSSVFVEGNYFRNCKYPMLISMQGSDVYDESSGSNDYSNKPTFSKEDGGIIKAWDNYIEGARRFVPYGSDNFDNSTIDFDAVVVSSRNEEINSSVVSSRGGNTYNNFDIDASVMYNYTADTPEEAKNKVKAYAGRMFGGDFTWTFDNSTDDTSYAVDTELKNALTSYQTSLVAIQGDGETSGGTTPDDPDNGSGDDSGDSNGETITGDVVHNFTESGLTNSFFNISGNLSDSKGTVTYGDLTMPICLKIESSTMISFTTSGEAVLTLIFNEGYSNGIKINGSNLNASDGILTINLPEGDYEITKKDVANLYYMSINYPAATTIRNYSAPEIQIYPNPVITSLSVSGNDVIQKIEIYSITGILIKAVSTPPTEIDVSDLTKGAYIIMTTTDTGVIKHKFFKQ